jgi:hypothetical protein
MQMKSVRLAPKKGRWPKSKRKQALRRYQLDAAGNYKKAMQRRDGSSGAASEVRHVYNRDPATTRKDDDTRFNRETRTR